MRASHIIAPAFTALAKTNGQNGVKGQVDEDTHNSMAEDSRGIIRAVLDGLMRNTGYSIFNEHEQVNSIAFTAVKSQINANDIDVCMHPRDYSGVPFRLEELPDLLDKIQAVEPFVESFVQSSLGPDLAGDMLHGWTIYRNGIIRPGHSA